jgi:hypothetical protein
MGLLLGQFCNGGFWNIIDAFTGTAGNGIGVDPLPWYALGGLTLFPEKRYN